MTTYAITFKLQSHSPYNEMSLEQPDVEFNLWCNYSKHVVEASFGKSSSHEQIVRAIRKTSGAIEARILRQVETSARTQLAVMTCACEKYKPTTWSVISKHNCLDIQPIIYKSGWEWYRILAFEQADVRSLFKSLARLGTPEVTNQSATPEFSLRDSFVLSTADLFGRMTRKQSEALATALRLGYFNIPRKTSTDEIAKMLGRPATTFREHLQKGESKLLKAIEPYLELGPG